MVRMVDPPGGWAYGFPAPLQEDYAQQLRDAGYPESDIPLALVHSWYHDEPGELMTRDQVKIKYGIDLAKPGSDKTVAVEYEVNGQTLSLTAINWYDIPHPAPVAYTGTASDGDDGA